MRSRDVPAPFFDLLVFGGQDAIHRPRRAQVLPVVEQGGIDLQRRLVLEALAVKHRHDGLPFRCCQRQRRPWPIDLRLGYRRLGPPVKGRPGDLQRLTGGLFYRRRDPVCQRLAARPDTGAEKFQGFGLADPLKGVS
jgi:hypothetical protein